MRLTDIHTGRGNLGITEALNDKKLEKDDDILIFFNEVQCLTKLMKWNEDFISSPKDKTFVEKIVCDRWLGGILGSTYFSFRKMGVPQQINDWMADRITTLAEETPSQEEFIIEDDIKSVSFGNVILQARNCEVWFWKAVKSRWGNSAIAMLKHQQYGYYSDDKTSNIRREEGKEVIATITANGRFLNLLSDYLTTIQHHTMYYRGLINKNWDNPNQSLTSDEEILDEIGSPNLLF